MKLLLVPFFYLQRIISDSFARLSHPSQYFYLLLKVDHGSASDGCLLCFTLLLLGLAWLDDHSLCSLLILVYRCCCCAASSKTCHLGKRICQLLEQQWLQFLHILHLPHVYIKLAYSSFFQGGWAASKSQILLAMMMHHHHVRRKESDFTHPQPSFLPLMCLMCI